MPMHIWKNANSSSAVRKGQNFPALLMKWWKLKWKQHIPIRRFCEELGRPSPKIDPALEHILITGMFHTFFELVIHEMPLDDAENYVKEMRAFYTAGWMKIMGQ